MYEIEKQAVRSNEYGEMYVFFGCRNELDDVYKRELQEAKKKGAITEVFTAYSRRTDQKVCALNI